MSLKPKCAWCEKLLAGKQTRFCSLSCKISQWRRDIKLRAVQYKGGRCQRCPYDKNYSAFVFHHRGGKVFKVADGRTRSWKKIQVELDKCEMICLNCHAEEHHPDTMLPCDPSSYG